LALESFFKKVSVLKLDLESEKEVVMYSLPQTGPILTEFI